VKNLFLHRSGKWYFRQYIPVDLRKHFGGRSDVAFSLKTSEKNQADLLVAKISPQYQSIFNVLRMGLPESAVKELLKTVRTQKKAKKRKKTVNIPKEIAPEPQMLLSTLFDLYTKEYQAGWTRKSKLEFQGWMDTLLFIMGDVDVSEIDRVACVSCRDALLRLPPNYKKKTHLRDMAASELIKLEGPGLNPNTVNKYTQLLSSILKWGGRYGYVKGHNSAEGLTLALTKSPSEQRKPFDMEDLQKVVANLSSDSPEKWIPLVAMYSGMRLEEICQLTKEDILELEGIPCFSLLNGKNLKTAASARIVPIHPMLIKLGLLDYTKRHPTATANLWGLEYSVTGFGKNYGKRFGLWLRKHVTTDKQKVFHSFRHTVSYCLKMRDVPEPLIMQILGHTNTNMSTGRYGARYPVDKLLDAISKLDYDLDFGALVSSVEPQGC